MVNPLILVTFFPLVGVGLLLLVPSDRHDTIRGVTLIVAFVTMLISIAVAYMFDPVASGMQHEVNVPWITSIGIDYHMGIDGISLLLILLTTVLTVLCVIASWRIVCRLRSLPT